MKPHNRAIAYTSLIAEDTYRDLPSFDMGPADRLQDSLGHPNRNIHDRKPFFNFNGPNHAGIDRGFVGNRGTNGVQAFCCVCR